MFSGRWGRRWGRLGLGLGVPVLLVAGVELGLRGTGQGMPTRFLLPARVDGQAVWVDNQVFGYRFFAPTVTRTPPPLVVPREKPANELRVVVLGESAAMGEPEPAYGPARMLERLLAADFPSRRVRVVNAAMTGINSHCIREIARDLGRLQPDVVILYIGNNEVVGPFGPGTVFAGGWGGWRMQRARVLASRLQGVGWVRSLLAGERGPVWEGMEAFVDRRVAEADPRLEGVYTALEKNLEGILTAVRRSGAGAVLCTVAVNLAGQAPLDGGAFPSGGTLAACRRARDADQLRFRADSRINDVIRRVAEGRGEVVLRDLERGFEAEGPPGRDRFLDHVHFTPRGSYEVAKSWRRGVFAALGRGKTPALLGQGEVLEQLVWTPYDEADVVDLIRSRYEGLPFRDAVDHAEQMITLTRWGRRVEGERRAMGWSGVRAAYRGGLAASPEDMTLRRRFLVHLVRAGRGEEAKAVWEVLRRREGHRGDVRGWGLLLAPGAGDVWEALTAGAPPLGSLPVDVLVGVSGHVRGQGAGAASLRLLEPAVERYPGRWRLQRLYANRLAGAGRRTEAEAHLRALRDRFPEAEWIARDLGALLWLEGRRDEARGYLAAVMESEAPEDRQMWAQMLRVAGEGDEAEAVVRRLLAEHPGEAAGWRLLGDLHLAAGRRGEAGRCLHRAATLEPWRVEGWRRLEGVSSALGWTERAAEARGWIESLTGEGGAAAGQGRGTAR